MFLIDNNLSPRLATNLAEFFPGIVHVSEMGLEAELDMVLWKIAQNESLHILTKDKDFNVIQGQKGFPPKIVLLKVGNVSTSEIVNLLKKRHSEIKIFIKEDSQGILVIP